MPCGSITSRCALVNGLALLCGVNLVHATEPIRHSNPNAMVRLTSGALKCLGGDSVDPGDHRPLVAAVLSPRMVYSLLEWPGMQREAEHLGFRVVAWRDPSVPDSEWRDALASPALAGWGVQIPQSLPTGCWARWAPMDHLPLIRVVLHADLHPWPLWGVMTSHAWQLSLNHRLNMLKTALPTVEALPPAHTEKSSP